LNQNQGSYKEFKMTDQRKRQTAYKVWISDLLANPYIKKEGQWESNYIEIAGKQVSRVNIIATAVSKFKSDDNTYVSITIDDGSAGIRLKTWREDTPILEEIEQGKIVNVIGKVREFNKEKYIIPEIVKVLDNPNWELQRKLELLKKGKPAIYQEKPVAQQIAAETTNDKIEEETIEEPVEDVFKQPKVEEIGNGIIEEVIEDIEETPREKILNLITKLDSPEGVEIEKVVEESKIEESKVDAIIEDLLKEGEVFQPMTGKLKVVK
tara:strand:+ start:12841 stop:13638 length:798 start_codon:yes stop_codon:yes gene_type:complete